MTDFAWPPEYTLKRHARARRVKLKTSAQKGFEVVVPKRFSLKHLPQIFEENREWIEKHLRNLQIAPELDLPDNINLIAIEQVWQVFYIKSNNKKLRLMERPHRELVLLGNIDDKNACIYLLSTWVRMQGQKYLIRMLQNVSEKINLPFKQVTIRGQKTRWGSCTSQKSISLNYKLLFLPTELVKHILIHELCHTVYLNHSTRFWRLVAKFDPTWKQSSRDIKRAEKWVPRWVE